MYHKKQMSMEFRIDAVSFFSFLSIIKIFTESHSLKIMATLKAV